MSHTLSPAMPIGSQASPEDTLWALHLPNTQTYLPVTHREEGEALAAVMQRNGVPCTIIPWPASKQAFLDALLTDLLGHQKEQAAQTQRLLADCDALKRQVDALQVRLQMRARGGAPRSAPDGADEVMGSLHVTMRDLLRWRGLTVRLSTAVRLLLTDPGSASISPQRLSRAHAALNELFGSLPANDLSSPGPAA